MTRAARRPERRRRRRRAALCAVIRAFGLWLGLLALPAPAWAGDWHAHASLPRPEWSSGGTAQAVAADPAGNAVAMVQQAGISGTGFFYPLTAVTWPVGQPPESPYLLDGRLGSDGNVAMDAQGNAVAVWTAHGDGAGIHAAFKPAGGSWQPTQTLSVVPDGVQSVNFGSADLAMSADGYAVATWTLAQGDIQGGPPNVLQAAVKPPGAATFGPPFDVSAINAYSESDVAIAPNDDAVLVWDGGVGGGIEGAVRPAGGAFAQLGTVSAIGRHPRVAVDARGGAVAVWDTGSGGVQAAVRDASGSFGPPQTVTTATSFQPQTKPQVAVEPDGTAVVAWITDPGNDSVEKYVVRWAARPSGGSFGAATDVFAALQQPALAMSPDGTTMLLSLVSRNVLQSSVRPPGGSFGTPQDVERSAKRLRNPVLAFDGGGDAVALWSRDEDAFNASAGLPYNTMRAARYDHDAPADPNLLYNDGFESDLAEWNTSGSSAGVTLTREPGGHSGDWAAKLTNTATSTGGCTLNDAPFIPLTTAPGTYTATLWVRGDTAGQTLRLRLREYSGSTLAGSQSTPITLTTSWQRVAVSYTPVAPGTSTLDLNAYVSGASPGTCFLADDASLTLESAPPPPPPPPPPAPDGLIANGGFESGLAGWNTSGSAAGVTLSREPGGHSGEWAAKLTNTAGIAGTCTLNDSPNAVATTKAGTYTARLWARAETSGQTLRLRLREYSGSTLAGSQTAQLTLSTAWQQVGVSYTPVAPGASTLDLNAYVSGAPPGTCFLADDASMIFEAAPSPPIENLIANSGFETDLTGWNTSGSGTGVALTREAGGHSGGWAAKVSNTGTTAASCTLNDSPNVIRTTETLTYTATLWVRGETAGQTLRLRLREYSGSTLAGSQSTSVTLTTSWQQVTVSYTPPTAGTTLDLNAYIAGAPPGTCFFADDAAMAKT